MIIYKKGDLFESKMKTIVNPVNCVGVMGKGIALTYKKKYPDMFKKYKVFCKNKQISPGMLYLYKDPFSLISILNFPTKNHWRDPSTLEYIELGLIKFKETYKSKNITSIAFPQLGCDNGGLTWNEVGPLMERYLSDIDIPVEIWIYP